jgi:hypothetical protein
VRFTNRARESGSRDEVVVEMQQLGMMKWPGLVLNCSVPQSITAR